MVSERTRIFAQLPFLAKLVDSPVWASSGLGRILVLLHMGHGTDRHGWLYFFNNAYMMSSLIKIVKIGLSKASNFQYGYYVSNTERIELTEPAGTQMGCCRE